MNLKLIKNNTSSPFRLQRSIVSQEEGAYANGGYNPNAVYNNDAANAAVEGLGTMIGAALTARGKDKKDVKKEDAKAKPSKKSEILTDDKNINIKDMLMSNYSEYSPEAIAPEKMRKRNKIENTKKIFSNFKF